MGERAHGTKLEVLAREHFAPRDLVILEIDPAALPCRVVDENLEGGATLFPHVYGHIPLAAVAQVHDFPCREDGTFELPAALC